jgi:hypothetical protein
MTLFPGLERQLAEAAERLAPGPAVAVAVAPRRSRRVRPRRVVALGVAAVVAAAVLVVVLLPSGGGPGSTALAAKTYALVDARGRLVHFVFDRQTHVGGGGASREVVERWQLGSASRTVIRSRVGGRAEVDYATSGGRTRSYVPATRRLTVSEAPEGAVADPFTAFRERYRAGAVKDAGPGTVGGRPVRRLRVIAGGRTITYSVREGTGVPVRVEVVERARQTPPAPGPGRVVRRVTEVLRYETLPATSANRALLALRVPPGVTVAQPPEAVGPGARQAVLAGAGSGSRGTVRWTSGTIAVDATGLAPGSHYALWIGGRFVGFAPPVGKDGRLTAQGTVSRPPSGALLVTVERSSAPARPGRVVLRGTVK